MLPSLVTMIVSPSITKTLSRLIGSADAADANRTKPQNARNNFGLYRLIICASQPMTYAAGALSYPSFEVILVLAWSKPSQPMDTLKTFRIIAWRRAPRHHFQPRHQRSMRRSGYFSLRTTHADPGREAGNPHRCSSPPGLRGGEKIGVGHVR